MHCANTIFELSNFSCLHIHQKSDQLNHNLINQLFLLYLLSSAQKSYCHFWHKFRNIINILGNISSLKCMVLKPICLIWSLYIDCVSNFFFLPLLCFSLYILLILVRGKHWLILLLMTENFSKAFNKLSTFLNYLFSHTLKPKK